MEFSIHRHISKSWSWRQNVFEKGHDLIQWRKDIASSPKRSKQVHVHTKDFDLRLKDFGEKRRNTWVPVNSHGPLKNFDDKKEKNPSSLFHLCFLCLFAGQRARFRVRHFQSIR